MALAQLLDSLRAKKRSAERSAFQHYLGLVKDLAAGGEADSDEVGHILDAADKNESDLEKDVSLQQQRLAWHAQLQQNKQATADIILAERDFLAAQRKLQAEIDRLSPAIQDAQNRITMLSQIMMTTTSAEARLSELVLDNELLEREAGIITELREVNDELRPLEIDREFKRQSLENNEFNFKKLQARKSDAWIQTGIEQFFSAPKDIRALATTVADLKSQLQQLDLAIHPRQAKQRRLQNELNQIHQQKLQP